MIKQLLEAQNFAFANKPLVAGFPFLAQVLREAGVQKNIWTLPACQSVYLMDDGEVVQQGTPLINGTFDIPLFNREALIEALRIDQAGGSTFPVFLAAIWAAGIISYEVDFISRHVTYFGSREENYREDYPAVVINR